MEFEEFFDRVVSGNPLLNDVISHGKTPKDLIAYLHRCSQEGISIPNLCSTLSLPPHDTNLIYLVFRRLNYFLALRSRILFEALGRDNTDLFIANHPLIAEVTTLNDSERGLVQTDFGRAVFQGFKEIIAEYVIDISKNWQPVFSCEFRNDEAVNLAYQIWFWKSTFTYDAWAAITLRLASRFSQSNLRSPKPAAP